MIKKIAKMTMTVLVVLILLSCSKSTEPEKTVMLQPLEIGNYWKYGFNTNSEILCYTVEEKLNYELDGGSIEIFRVAMANLNYYWFNDQNGFHYIQDYPDIAGQDSLVDYSVLKYKFPVDINDVWYEDFAADGYTTGDNTVTCISSNTIIECPAGEFECIVYKTTCPELSENYFISYCKPGVGLVKQIYFDATANSFQEKILVEYYIAE